MLLYKIAQFPELKEEVTNENQTRIHHSTTLPVRFKGYAVETTGSKLNNPKNTFSSSTLSKQQACGSPGELHALSSGPARSELESFNFTDTSFETAELLLVT